MVGRRAAQRQRKTLLQRKLDGLSVALQAVGLTINTSKSFCIHIVTDSISKRTVIADIPCSLSNNVIRSLSATDTFRYLGVSFTPFGLRKFALRNKFYAQLQEITAAPLKPFQRLVILKIFLIPKYTHQFVLGSINKSTLKKLDNSVRKELRKWLKIPKDTPTGFFHAPPSAGGIGVPNLSSWVPILKKARFGKLLGSQSLPARSAGNFLSTSSSNKMCNEPVKVGDEFPSSTLELKTAWRKKLHSSHDGRILTACNKMSSYWVGHPTRIFPRAFIRGLKLRANLLPTKPRVARWKTAPSDTNCRHGCQTPESLYHISQRCPRTHGSRVSRHDKIVRYLFKLKRKREMACLREPQIPTDNSYIKPDLIFIDSGTAYVVDVQVCGDFNSELSYDGKVRKYGDPNTRTRIEQFLVTQGFSVSKVLHHPFVITFRGFIFPKSVSALKHLLKLSNFIFSDISIIAVCGSLSAFDCFMMGT